MLDALKGFLSSGPTTRWFAEVIESGFVQSATLEEERYKKKTDHSHVLSLEFEEPVRDGNDVSHLNMRNEDGRIVDALELYGGESSTAINLNVPDEQTLDAVAVRTDDTVRDTSRIKLYEEVITNPVE